MLTLTDFDFDLPTDLIAQYPLSERSASRLLHLDQNQLYDRQFINLPQLLRPDDLLVLNDTKVINARFFGKKASGGKIEVLLERITEPAHALAQIRASKTPQPGSQIIIENTFTAEIIGREDDFFHLHLINPDHNWWQLSMQYGRLPLPPYITHDAAKLDSQRYQTVFATQPGAVAAPTAGLHFDETMLSRLAEMGIKQARLTLHVGAGTFQPVRYNDISKHRMHHEHYDIPAATREAIAQTRERGGRIIAVGTTSLRALEAAAQNADDYLPKTGHGQTDIFITPGYRFLVVDALLTNFHLPRSTLLMLVAAFTGLATIRHAYAHAIAERYRFFSYGDAMLIEPIKKTIC